jgi:tetratricopeptide (TPR) repeat protein
MSKFDRKKFREELRKKELEAMEKNPFENFEGSQTELFLLKVSHYIAKNKFIVLGILLSIVLAVAIAIGVDEYLKYKHENAVAEIEKIEKKHSKDPAITLDAKIQDYETFLQTHDSARINIRTFKSLANLYAEKKDFEKASSYMEKAANLASDVAEVQAYLYYSAGNLFEANKNYKKALENYSKASGLTFTNRELPNLNAMIYYSMARMKLEEGQKDAAVQDLKKLLEIEAKYENPVLSEAKQMATYLILKLNKG